MGQCLVFLCHPPITRRPSTMSWPWQTSCPASAAELLLDRGACRLQASGDSTGGRAWRGACRLQASGDSTGGRARSRMTTTTVRARRVGRPSSSAEWWTVSVSSVQDTICSRHNLSRHVSQDTICSRHDLLSEIQPMSTSPAPVIEYVASVSAITYTALSPVTEYVAPAPVVTYAVASWDIDYVSRSN